MLGRWPRSRPHARSQRPSRARRTRLRVEQLETRTVPAVLTPAQVRHAYGFDQIFFSANGRTVAGDGSGQTIAIVAAYDNPNILQDLRTFDAAFGLPDPPSFTKATPQGLPRVDRGWAGEIALDVEWAHAIAPGANILLVEAASAGVGDLLQAVDYARRQPGVVAVSMSWGAREFANEALYDGTFTTPPGHLGGSNLPGGVTFVAASGDDGAWYGAEWPAASPRVLAVGGTTLRLDAGSGYGTEAGWNGSGGGYSRYAPEPGYQRAAQASGLRATPDVAYNASPDSAVFVFDSTNGGWFAVGGTSAAAPQWAALVAVADQGRALAGQGSLDGATQTLYALYNLGAAAPATYFHDVTSGSNGYAARPGYDLLTGLGSPRADRLVQALVNARGSGEALTFTVTASTAVAPQTTLPRANVTAAASDSARDQAVSLALAELARAAARPAPAASVAAAATPAQAGPPSANQGVGVASPGSAPAPASSSSPTLNSWYSGSGSDEDLPDDAEGDGAPRPVPVGPPRPDVVPPATPKADDPVATPARPLEGADRLPDDAWLEIMPDLAAPLVFDAPELGPDTLAAAAGLAIALGGYWRAPRAGAEEDERRRPSRRDVR